MTVGLVLIANFMWTPLTALHLRALGADDVQIGVAFSVFTLLHSLPALLGGMLADRFGRKWVITLPGLLTVPLYVLASLTRDWLIFSILLSCTNFLGSLQWPAMQAFMSESDEERRAMAFSFIEIFVLGAVIVGPLLGSFLLPTLGISGLIFLHALALVPASVVRATQLHETHHEAHRSTPNLREWRTAIPSGALWIIGANAVFALTIGLSFEGPFSALLSNDVWKLDEQQIQWMNSLGGAFALTGIWIGGKADQWGGRRIWILSASGLALALAGWGLSPRWELGIVFFLIGHIFYEIIFIVSETLLAQHSTQASRSSVFGVMSTMGGISTATGPTLGAWAASLSSLAAPFLIGAVSSLASLGFLSRVTDTPEAETGEIVAEEFVAAHLVE